MANAIASTISNLPEGVGGQDSSRLLMKMFTGHLVGKPAMGWACLTGVIVSADTSSGTVTIDNFSDQCQFSVVFETRIQWPGIGSPPTPVAPPGGTACLVSFPPNSGQPWVVAFFSDYSTW